MCCAIGKEITPPPLSPPPPKIFFSYLIVHSFHKRVASYALRVRREEVSFSCQNLMPCLVWMKTIFDDIQCLTNVALQSLFLFTCSALDQIFPHHLILHSHQNLQLHRVLHLILLLQLYSVGLTLAKQESISLRWCHIFQL